MDRKPTPRTQTGIPLIAHVLLIAIVLAMSIFGIFKAVEWHRFVREVEEESSTSVPERSMSSLAPSYLNDGTLVCWYVFVDPETGRQYLYNDLGGVTPRVTSDGEQMEANPYAEDGFVERGL